jgi:hypothetical protein
MISPCAPCSKCFASFSTNCMSSGEMESIPKRKRSRRKKPASSGVATCERVAASRSLLMAAARRVSLAAAFSRGAYVPFYHRPDPGRATAARSKILYHFVSRGKKLPAMLPNFNLLIPESMVIRARGIRKRAGRRTARAAMLRRTSR